MRLVDQIRFYFDKRGLVFPSFDNAMKFIHTELGEVYEQDLARSGDWVRNNPQNHPPFDKKLLAEELSDVLLMVLVAGMAEDIDLVDVMTNKMERKLKRLEENKTVTQLIAHLGAKDFEIISEKEAEKEEKNGN